MLNEECLDLALRATLLLNCQVRPRFTFERKHYLYPDLPHGYQITQYYEPYAEHGHVYLEDHNKNIPIERIQMEMDSGKMYEQDGRKLVDMNRAGVGLLELVTPPVMRSASEAVSFSKKVRDILRHGRICHGGLESGQFRMDVNVSVTGPRAPAEAGPLGTRVEIKNLNSFASLARVIEAEANRHVNELENGQRIRRETRGFDPLSGLTFATRSKEDASDYRFIRDFDIPPVTVTAERLEAVRKAIPKPIEVIRNELVAKYGLSSDQAAFLLANETVFDLFTAIMNHATTLKPALAYHLLTIDYSAALHNLKIDPTGVRPDISGLSTLIRLIQEERVPRNKGRALLEAWLPHQDKDMESLASRLGLLIKEGDTSNVRAACEAVLALEPAKWNEVQEGKRSLDYFMGPLVKQLKGKAKPQDIRSALSHLLNRSD